MLARFGRFFWPLFLVMSTVSALAPQGASAQLWLADRRTAQGRGIRAGDFEIHPGLGAEIGYDSNVTNASGAATGPTGPIADVISSAVLRVTPHVYLTTLTGERTQEGGDAPAIIFSGGLNASYYHWFGTSGTADNVEGDLNAHLDINHGKPVALVLDERFTRTVRPYADSLSGTTPDYGRNTNAVGAQGIFTTTGGVLSGRLGYTFVYDFFDYNQFAYANNFDHQFLVAGSYRFLPRTAIVYDFNADYMSYQPAGSAPSALLSNGFRLATRIGLNGAFTSRLSASAMIGYAAGFYENMLSSDYESLVAQVEARWQISDGARLALGYDRNFYPAFIGNFVRRDRGYANFQLLVSGQFLLGLEVAVGLLDFGTPLAPGGAPLGMTTGGNPARSDVILVGSVFAEYRFTDWFGLNATLRYTGDFTDWQFTSAGGTLGTIAPGRYNKFEAYFGARIFL